MAPRLRRQRGQVHVFGQRLVGERNAIWPKNGPVPGVGRAPRLLDKAPPGLTMDRRAEQKRGGRWHDTPTYGQSPAGAGGGAVCAGDGSGRRRAPAVEVLMKDGRLLKGKIGYTSGLAEMNIMPDAASPKDTPIAFIDNDLRRIFVSMKQDPAAASPRRRGPGAGEVPRPSEGAALGADAADGGSDHRHRAVRRIRPPHHPHEHGPRADRHQPGHHRDHAGVDEGRRDHLRLGHADRHQLDPPRHPPQDPDEADRPQGHRGAEEAGQFLPAGRTFRGGPRRAGSLPGRVSREHGGEGAVGAFDPSCGNWRRSGLAEGIEDAARRRAAPVRAGDAAAISFRRRAGRNLAGGAGDDAGVRDLRARSKTAVEQIDASLAKIKDRERARPSSRCETRSPSSWATTTWIAWRPFCKTPTTRDSPPRTSWRWPSAAGCWDRTRRRRTWPRRCRSPACATWSGSTSTSRSN